MSAFGVDRGPESDVASDKGDFHRGRYVRRFVKLDRNGQSSPGQGSVVDVRAQLEQEQSRRFGLRAALGELGKSSNLLQQFH